LNYELVVCRILNLEGNAKGVALRLERMNKINPSHPCSIHVRECLENDLAEEEEEEGEDQEEENDDGFTVNPEMEAILAEKRAALTAMQTLTPPTFNIDLIYKLYKDGFDMEEETIQGLLQSDRNLLRADLEEVLRDGIRRYGFYRPRKKTNAWTMLLAMILLAEIQSEQSLDLILEFLSQSEEFVDFWIGEALTEDVWEILYWTGRNQMHKVMAFACDEANFYYARRAVPVMLAQWALHEPEKRPIVVEYFRQLFEKTNPVGISCTDAQLEFNTHLTDDCVSVRLTELIPVIEKLIAEKRILPGFGSMVKPIQERMDKKADSAIHKRPLLRGELREKYREG
jgi:hypothetical protein